MFDDEQGDGPVGGDGVDPSAAAGDDGAATAGAGAAGPGGAEDHADGVGGPAGLAGVLQAVSALVGLPLAVGLAAVVPDGQDPGDLVELAAQWSRVIAWAHYQRAETLSVLAVQAIDRDGVNAVTAVATEVAMRQGVSRPGATRLVRTAMALTGPLQATGEALARGALDPRKADVIAAG
ncbi:DUF222 domain-containing protein, partial [Georgenia ruanii]|uniref:DUF222 domain-containing protein n=1 Tax=Georgenia ruanii TaxID=348442 RepID=UPI0012641F5B